METKRTFLAIDVELNEKLTSFIDRLTQTFRMDNIKWVEPHNLHLTLFFLGDTPSPVIDSVAEDLTTLASKYHPMKLTLKGVGTFGRPLPRVVWIGVDYSATLLDLKNDIDMIFKPYGFSEVDQSFKPHLTIGRIKFLHQFDKLSRIVQDHKSTIFQEFEFKRLVLYESILRPKGPDYVPLHVFELEPF